MAYSMTPIDITIRSRSLPRNDRVPSPAFSPDALGVDARNDT